MASKSYLWGVLKINIKSAEGFIGMNIKTIEILAVNAVRDSIAVCDYMEPYLSDNDKTPSWDGEIFIYDKPDRKKEHLRGSVKVQIKGKEQRDLTRDSISYSVSVVDLRNFQRIGSTIYFVVYVSPNKTDKQIYYNDLKPVKLNHYIKTAKGKTIKIPFKRFPNDSTDKTDICVNLYDDGVKQISCQEHILSLDDLRDKNVTKIDLSYTSYARTSPDIIQHMLDNTVSLYVQLEGSDLLYPLDNTDIKLQIEHQLDVEVRVGKELFYSQVSVRRTANEFTTRIGDSLNIIYIPQKQQLTFIYRLSKSLRHAVVDLAFMNTVMNVKEFSLNDTIISIPRDITDSYNYAWGESTLTWMKDCVSVLEILKVEKDIEWEKLSPQEQRDFATIIQAFVKEELIYNLDENTPPVCAVQIQNIKLLLGVLPNKTIPNAWTMYNVFEYPARHNIQYKKTKDSHALPTSIYTVLKPNDYVSIDNINYETLPDTYKCLKRNNPMLVDIVNIDLLTMLLAYDIQPNERLLTASENLARWILDEKSFPELPFESRYLNLMQIYRRVRSLTKEEKEQIYNIYDKATMYDTKVAALLLLDNHIGAKHNFAKMSESEQEFFKTLPIYHFWVE